MDRLSGQVIFRLGGTKSDFALGAGASFAWQHNPIADGPNTLGIFDQRPNIGPSRVIWVHRDEAGSDGPL